MPARHHLKLPSRTAEAWEKEQSVIQKAARQHAQKNKGRPPEGVHADDVRKQRRILDQEEATGISAEADGPGDKAAGASSAARQKRRPAGDAGPSTGKRLRPAKEVWTCSPFLEHVFAAWREQRLLNDTFAADMRLSVICGTRVGLLSGIVAHALICGLSRHCSVMWRASLSHHSLDLAGGFDLSWRC